MHANDRGRTLTHAHARTYAHRHGRRRACTDADEHARTQTYALTKGRKWTTGGRGGGGGKKTSTYAWENGAVILPCIFIRVTVMCVVNATEPAYVGAVLV